MSYGVLEQQERIPVFLSSDDGYAAFVATTIVSICENTKSFVEFYVLDGGISEENKSKIEEVTKGRGCSIEFLGIDTDKHFGDLPVANFYRVYSLSMYSRFLIPDLKPNIKKAIYSDVDMIALGDIAELYHEDLGEYTIGAVWEKYHPGLKERKARLQLSCEHRYFNSGVLLVDCEKWRQQSVTEKLLKLGEELLSCLEDPDQDILNKLFDNNYKELSNRYCFFWANSEFSKTPNCVIRHFAGGIKPWYFLPSVKEEDWDTLSVKDFWRYVKMTPFYRELIVLAMKKTVLHAPKWLLQTIFSIRNSGSRKVLTILGIKIKLRRKLKV